MLQRRHFEEFAKEIKQLLNRKDAEKVALLCISIFKRSNSRFNEDKFLKACGL